jgi:hypothetical protein
LDRADNFAVPKYTSANNSLMADNVANGGVDPITKSHERETYEGLTTSKVLPSEALTNLLLMNKPVLIQLACF